MGLLDGKPKVATEEHVRAPWGGAKNGRRFRCYLCGHRFKVGDVWRFIYAGSRHLCNLMVCESCDEGDERTLDKWQALYDEYNQPKFWWFRDDTEARGAQG